MSETEGRHFPLEVVLSVSSGKLLCDFSAMHECVEYLTGGPVWTHEMGNRDFVDLLKRDVLRQAPGLAGLADGVTTENVHERLAAIRAANPATVRLTPIPDYGRTSGPLETLAEMVGDKPVVVLDT